MTTLPAFYIDNVRLIKDSTKYVRGNTVTNITGKNATGIKCANNNSLRVKNNKVHNIKATSGVSSCYSFSNVADLVAVYNVANKANIGIYLNTITSNIIYNVTVHNCSKCMITNSNLYLRNAAFSATRGTTYFNNYYGVELLAGATLDIDYTYYYKTAGLVTGGSATLGDRVLEEHLLYEDEFNDAFTPDYLSPAINAGTENPLRVVTPDIGGVNTKITTETFADPRYWYNFLDNEFWDITNEYSVEGTLVKAFQSRVFAAYEDTLSTQKRNTYIKYADSVLKFSENYPMYARYANASKFAKRVSDMWYSGQNVGVLQTYQNAIGGYNLIPTFFKHISDYEDGWVIGVSYVAYDNWLLGYQDAKYGIALDVLGVSTLSRSASAECYENVMNSVADVGPVRWALHDEVQPTNYLVFTDQYNGFEDCVLSNMVYTDDFTITIDETGSAGALTTPVISTEAILTSSVQVSGVELSLLDRTYSENIIRTVAFRQGNTREALSSWEVLPDVISRQIDLTDSFVQFKVELSGIIRKIDYEFIGLALRPYYSARDWTET